MKRRSLTRPKRPAFLLVLVVVVIAIATLVALRFSRAMLVNREVSQISSMRLQARMCAESGLQAVRLFLAYPRAEQMARGGTQNNDQFYARNVIPDLAPERRGNYTIVAPDLDEYGNYFGFRYGLQNESTKVNLNTLSQLDSLAASGAGGEALTGGAGGGGGGGDSGAAALSMLASEMTSAASSSMSSDILMSIPGMTVEIADAILDWLDEDEEPREYGAEFADYYADLQPAYKPANGPINSIEQLLLVRGVTPQLLFGYDDDRNGYLDDSETQRMNSGAAAGLPPGTITANATDPNATEPPALGWSQYFTLHSQEKNVDSTGLPRININGSDLTLLYEELSAALGNEEWASFIVAYRFGGKPGGNGQSPLATLATMAASDGEPDGAMGAQLAALAPNQDQAGDAGGQGGGPPQPWTSAAMASFDLTQQGGVQFTQVLDLIDATVTVQQGNNSVTYSSPFSSLPVDLAVSTPVIMDLLTTTDAEAIPGRINIMRCPQEILYGIPGLSPEIAEQILEARIDGSETETRNFETWLAVEGFLTMDEMRALEPLITCGGDVYKAQIVGYMEGNAAFSRIEAIVSGAGDVPMVLFYRKMDHLGRGFDISTLGQRFDAGMQGGSLLQ